MSEKCVYFDFSLIIKVQAMLRINGMVVSEKAEYIVVFD